jgi:hypothetical protein
LGRDSVRIGGEVEGEEGSDPKEVKPSGDGEGKMEPSMVLTSLYAELTPTDWKFNPNDIKCSDGGPVPEDSDGAVSELDSVEEVNTDGEADTGGGSRRIEKVSLRCIGGWKGLSNSSSQ